MRFASWGRTIIALELSPSLFCGIGACMTLMVNGCENLNLNASNAGPASSSLSPQKKKKKKKKMKEE